jgi:hypothetical protein
MLELAYCIHYTYLYITCSVEVTSNNTITFYFFKAPLLGSHGDIPTWMVGNLRYVHMMP